MAKKRCFPDDMSAEIFVREFAQCQITGKNLWVLDSGIVNWDWDAIDHWVPYSKGGKTETSNGVLLSSNINYILGNSEKKEYYTECGFPTARKLSIDGEFSQKNINQIIKFSALEISDYYFNRALSFFLCAAEYRFNPIRVNGKPQERTDEYYLNVSVKKLIEWEKQKSENYKTFEERGLVDKKKLEADQKILLKLRDVKTVDDARNLLDKIMPFYKHVRNLSFEFNKIYNLFLEKTFLESVKES